MTFSLESIVTIEYDALSTADQPLAHGDDLMTDTTDKLKSDLRDVALDIQELLKATAGQGGEGITAARERIEATLKQAQAAVQNIGGEVAERAKQAAGDVNEYVHENPWTTIGIATGVGFLIGYLMGRR